MIIKMLKQLFNQIIENQRKRNWPMWYKGDLECTSDWPQFNRIIDREAKRRAEIENSIKKIRKFVYSFFKELDY